MTLFLAYSLLLDVSVDVNIANHIGQIAEKGHNVKNSCGILPFSEVKYSLGPSLRIGLTGNEKRLSGSGLQGMRSVYNEPCPSPRNPDPQ
jgi:hypothetical protein